MVQDGCMTSSVSLRGSQIEMAVNYAELTELVKGNTSGRMVLVMLAEVISKDGLASRFAGGSPF